MCILISVRAHYRGKLPPLALFFLKYSLLALRTLELHKIGQPGQRKTLCAGRRSRSSRGRRRRSAAATAGAPDEGHEGAEDQQGQGEGLGEWTITGWMWRSIILRRASLTLSS